MALDTMGLIGGTDVLREISMRLEESHLTYLQLDESPSKLQARQKLEGFIKEYLCHVPNERKYVFQETADILHRSAATVKDFSGYRACTAWRALSLYAANLLAQPWRKEYRTLRTYSGYYKHEIEANLIGAELMFELMGYKHTGLGVLTLEGPIDPDRVSSVSRDAIVAYVECQILKEIWENVSQKFTVSWLEVLEFRCNSVGTPEQAIRALNFRFLERLHREKSSPITGYRDYIPVQPLTMEPCLPSLLPSTIPYAGIGNNYNPTIMPTVCKPDSVYPPEGNYYFAPADLTSPSRCANSYQVFKPATSHYYPVGQAQVASGMISPGHATRVPTGRLIELGPPVPVVSGNYERNRSVLNEISNRSRSRSHEIEDIDYRDDYAIVDKSRSIPTSRSHDEAEDWEFVYRNLDSRGYSKDLGDRDDVLRKEYNLEPRNSRQSIDQDKYERHHGSRIARDEKKKHVPVRTTNDLDLSNGQENRSERKKSSLDLPDSVVTEKILAFEKNGKKYSNTLPASRNVYKNEAREAKQDIRWSCATCTFFNSQEREICEMCGKSRRKGNEDKPLASGGKECPQCTLVNEKNASNCEVCTTSLVDSPTYI